MRLSPRARVTLTTAAALVALAGWLHDVSAQTPDRRFTQQMTEGTTYVVAFPQLWHVPTEKPTSTPLQIHVGGRSAARVTISCTGQLDLPAFERTVDVQPGRLTRVSVPIGYMTSSASTRIRNALTVRATAPVSVYTSMAWNGGGEMARHLPVTAWGTSYRTFNLYQDQFGTGNTIKYRPGQILIIAQQDSTTVTYVPTTATEAGTHAASVSKGTPGTIVLRQGETFLIKANIDPSGSKEDATDLTGTSITSDKPIAVISGHTKGAIGRMPSFLPPTGSFAADAHFVRNGIHEALLPESMAGKEFVTVPMMYTSARVTGNGTEEFGIDDDRGDAIRVVALADNTNILLTRMDGTGVVQIGKTLRRGESRTVSVQLDAGHWTTTKPALMMQYGKSYARVLPPAQQKNGDVTQGHPTVEAGMPCMLTVPSIDRWAPYAIFDAPEGLDNFLSVVCRTDEASKISLDGHVRLSDVPSGARPIPNTPYSYVRMSMPAGSHVIEATDTTIRFAAWSYGSLDGLQQGRAYGAPLTVSLNVGCDDDDVAIDDTVDASNGLVIGIASLTGGDACAVSVDVGMVSSTNYTIELPTQSTAGVREMPFVLRVVDPTKDAVAVVHATSTSGKVLERTYTYKGAPTSVNDTDLDHSLVLTPNPVTDVLHVQGIDANAHVQIVTMAGAGIDMPVSDRIDVSSLPPGPYMLKVVEGGVVRTARFVVVR